MPAPRPPAPRSGRPPARERARSRARTGALPRYGGTCRAGVAGIPECGRPSAPGGRPPRSGGSVPARPATPAAGSGERPLVPRVPRARGIVRAAPSLPGTGVRSPAIPPSGRHARRSRPAAGAGRLLRGPVPSPDAPLRRWPRRTPRHRRAICPALPRRASFPRSGPSRRRSGRADGVSPSAPARQPAFPCRPVSGRDGDRRCLRPCGSPVPWPTASPGCGGGTGSRAGR